MDLSILNSLIEVPLWLLMSSCIAGALLCLLMLSVALWLTDRVKAMGDKALGSVAESIVETLVDTARPSPSLVKPSGISKAGHQHYWYYVAGAPGCFAVLREALQAAGVKVDKDKLLDWKKLPVSARSKIKRVGVKEEQPAYNDIEPATDASADVPQPEKKATQGHRMAPPPDAPDMIQKPLGNGCYVTVRKKNK